MAVRRLGVPALVTPRSRSALFVGCALTCSLALGAALAGCSGSPRALGLARRGQAEPLAAVPTPEVALTALVPSPPERAQPAPAVAAVPPSACHDQPPQPFLIRGSYAWKIDDPPAERLRKRELHDRAIAYRTKRYGHVEGFGEARWNPRTPSQNARDGSFFGVPVRMNAKVLVALGCVEEALRQTCGEGSYTPRLLDGLRTRNTFHGSEVSNHLYGIAIDIDFDKNSCCGCVPPLSEWPRCKVPAASPFERTEIPECWVATFERFGFYWLGYDQLEDTMHFEFLGDPDRISRAASDG